MHRLGRQSQTRERLVRTAGELFWQQGYAQTGVSSIMKRARATSGSFYHFFSTKDDLLVAVIEAVADKLESEVLGPAEAASADPIERIGAVMGAYRRSIEADPADFGLPVGNLVSELGSRHEEARTRIDAVLESFTNRVADWLADDGDRIPRRIDRHGIATLVVATLEGAAVVAMARRSRAPVDACAEQIRLHLESLAIGRVSRADQMPPPEHAETEAADWKAW
jgi:AcrR family transcriptional regulator